MDILDSRRPSLLTLVCRIRAEELVANQSTGRMSLRRCPYLSYGDSPGLGLQWIMLMEQGQQAKMEWKKWNEQRVFEKTPDRN
jgi:hypothetical protein